MRELLDRYDVRPTKALGQNFVIDPNTIRKITALAELEPSDRVLEIGAGAGSLTYGLAATGASITALEFDRKLVQLLSETVGAEPNVTIVDGDAMRFDYGTVDANKIVGNLPYNIATPLVLNALEQAPQVEDIVVMTQREVGERMAAAPGSKAYGQMTVLIAFHASAAVAARISRRVFFPVPNVDSVVVRIRRDPVLRGVEYRPFKTVVKAGFAQRRKTLRNNLLAVAPADAVEGALAAAGIPAAARAETVSLEGFINTVNNLLTTEGVRLDTFRDDSDTH